jgi:hypothetical protein
MVDAIPFFCYNSPQMAQIPSADFRRLFFIYVGFAVHSEKYQYAFKIE